MGLSLSTEFGYQKAAYSAYTWNIEIRPIIDKQWSKLYVSFNPTMGVALKSQFATNSTPTFEPNLKMAYTCFKNDSLGFEYYGDTGYINHFEAPSQQSHALYLVYDMLNNPQWEFNIGAGFGLNDATDPFLLKVILGKRASWQR